jgi:squalene-hopene/tetraprenyl-beta-curcumene cyclase
MGSAGLYYYYNVFAAALSASGSDTITDTNSVQHDWRSELVE